MKKNRIFWMFAVLMLVVGMSSCSSDDDSNLDEIIEKGKIGELLTPLYSSDIVNWYDRNMYWETVGKWNWQVLVD